jgi:hypothetical protein
MSGNSISARSEKSYPPHARETLELAAIPELDEIVRDVNVVNAFL